MRSSSDAVPPIPRIPTTRRKVAFLAICGVVLASMFLVIVLNFDRSPESEAGPTRQNELDTIDGPTPLQADELGSGIQSTSIQPHAVGATRAWIQIIEPDGTASKQYRFASLDPLPDGWSKMTKPQIEAKMGSDRIVRLESDHAMVHMPAKRPEAGTLSGNVVIRTYGAEAGKQFDTATAPLLLEIRTQEATFDNTRGEIRCDGALTLETPNASLEGSGLRLLLNEVAQRAEWLRMEEATVRVANPDESQKTDADPSAASAPAKPARTEKRETTATSPSGNGKKAAGPTFYRLTFQKSVRIAQGASEDAWIAEGDELAIIFSTQGKSLSRSLTQRIHAEPMSAVAFLPQSLLWPSIVLASVSEPQPTLFTPSDDDIVITCDEGITMRPLEQATQRPTSADDARFELIGSPVRLRNATERVIVTGRALEYRLSEQIFKIVGDEQHALNIDAPQLLATANQLWIDRIKNIGAFEGKGWMVVRDDDQSAPDVDAGKNPDRNVRIDWRDKVDLAFSAANSADAEADSNPMAGSLKLRRAGFLGDVKVNNPELSMRADAMDVTIPESDSKPTSPSIESMVAKGSVTATSLTDSGSIDCGQLEIAFGQDHDGRTVPVEAVATQQVAANDVDNQRVWCNRLHVQFDSGAPRTSTDDGKTQRVNVKQLTATEHVQALLSNGARAFADKLEADPVAETIALTGSDVIVVSDQSLIHGGSRLEFHQKTNLAEWPGDGEFIQYATPIVHNDLEPVATPSVAEIDLTQNPRKLVARWNDSMTYDAAYDNGAGQIVLRGDVHAESDPSTLQHNTLDAHELTLQFGRLAADATSSAKDPSSLSDDSGRQMKLLIAKGFEEEFAKIESLTWNGVDHSDAPRIFYIAGAHIEYDDQTFEAVVKGKGELLVSDQRPAADKQQAQQEVPAFSAKGDTSFRWTDRLAMKRVGEQTFDIQMDGGIHVIHRALDQSMTKITCRRLGAMVERSAAPQKDNEAMDFGGAMAVTSLRGSSNVYIDSPTRDIDCAEFDYDNVNGIANLVGPPGGTVAVTTQGDATPLRAQRVVWNMKTNTVTATEISGAPAR